MFTQVHAVSSCSASQSPAWQICGPIESPNTLNVQTNVIQTSDGNLNMAWASLSGTNLVVYNAVGTWTGAAWSWTPGSSITPSPGKNENPALAQFANTSLAMFWAYKPVTTPNFQLYYISAPTGSFSHVYHKVPLTTSTSLNDTLPSVAVGRDGTLWLVWTRDNSTAAGNTHIMRQLWYKTFKNGVWSNEQPLTSTTDANWNYQSSVAVGKDGTVRVAFARGPQSTQIFDVYYLTYNGSVWSSPFQVSTQTSTQDAWPSIAQDRNGTFWIFWARNLGSNTTAANSLFESSSTNGGSSWSSATGLTPTNCGSSGCTDSEYPSVVQSSADKNITVFFATNPVSNFNIYGLVTTHPVSPVHDVAIVPYAVAPSVQFFPTNVTKLYPGGIHDPFGWVNGSYSPLDQSALVQVLARVQNNGDFTENVSFSLSATNSTYSISTVFATSVFQLPPGAMTNLQLTWNTTAWRPARYGISGNASIPVATFGNKPDGLMSTTNLVHLFPRGDIDWDGSVTIGDATVTFFAFNSVCTSASNCSSRYMAAQYADFAGVGTINIQDATIVSSDFNIFT